MKKIISDICLKEGIHVESLIKINKGFSSDVYLINDMFICKIASIDNAKLNKEISVYKNVIMKQMPKFICSGVLNNFIYLIIEKIDGDTLYSIWHTLSDQERKKIILSVSDIIKDFNKKDYKFLDESYRFVDWNNYILNNLISVKERLNSLNLSSKFIDEFINKYFNKLFENNNIRLCFNDIHFDNFVYSNGEVYIIDFDRVIAGAIDYELMIFKTMCENPKKFASEEDEENVVDRDYKNIYNWFLMNYKQLQEIEFLNERVKVYQFIYLINQFIDCGDNKQILEIIDDFMKFFEIKN